MVVLQWNMGIFEEGQNAAVEEGRTRLLEQLLQDYQPQLVALQEAPRKLAERALRNGGFSVADPVQRLVTAWHNAYWGAPLADPIRYRRMSAVVLPRLAPDGISHEVLVCNVHLPSPAKHGSQHKTVESLNELLLELADYRTRRGTTQQKAELILGDFNLEPHTLRLQERTGLYGNRSLAYVREREQKWQRGDRYRPLYNPTWRLYGADVAPHGTHYYTGQPDEPWYVYDQAFFSSNLAAQPVDMKLITSIGGLSLLSRNVGQPNSAIGSDHLPIIWVTTPV
jgi:endonuclease/exonuclease/phosphatase family metal-dependent hydrolase